MIDVHMIVMPDSDPMQRAMIMAQLSMEGVDVHLIDGVQGDLRGGRHRGYAAGANPWVTYVDPDDQIERGIFYKIRSALRQYPDVNVLGCNEFAKFGNIRRLRPLERSRTSINRFHHLTVYRREAVERFDYRDQPEMAGIEFLRAVDMLSTELPFLYLDLPGYIWTAGNPQSYSHAGLTSVVNMQLLANRLAEANPLGLVFRQEAFRDNELVGEPITMRPFCA